MTDTTEVQRFDRSGDKDPNGEHVRASDYDTLAAKLAESEAERAVNIAMLNEDAEAMEQAAAKITSLKARAEAAEAALPAVYRLGLEDAASRFDEIAQHDQGGIDYSDLVGIPISNREQLVKSVKDAEMDAKYIRALPTPTAAELMARIQTGEKK